MGYEKDGSGWDRRAEGIGVELTPELVVVGDSGAKSAVYDVAATVETDGIAGQSDDALEEAKVGREVAPGLNQRANDRGDREADDSAALDRSARVEPVEPAGHAGRDVDGQSGSECCTSEGENRDCGGSGAEGAPEGTPVDGDAVSGRWA
jgi:hypothetical protein